MFGHDLCRQFAHNARLRAPAKSGIMFASTLLPIAQTLIRRIGFAKLEAIG